MITVYYDGNCKLCSREISYYKRISKDRRFEWVDIFADEGGLEKHGINKGEALRMLHTKDDLDRIFIGIHSFILIWQNLTLPWQIIGYVASFPVIRMVLEFFYKRFADKRFVNLGYCNLEQ